MPTAADAWRRWLGMFCLAVATGLLIWGQTILQPYLEGIAFLVYWFFCFLFTIAAIGIALLDVRAVRRRTREERRQLIERTFGDLEFKKRERPGKRSQ